MTNSVTMREGCQMVWNYLASGHGKGEVDGTGAFMKREIRTKQMKPNGEKLQNAEEIVEFLKTKHKRYMQVYKEHNHQETSIFGSFLCLVPRVWTGLMGSKLIECLVPWQTTKYVE